MAVRCAVEDIQEVTACDELGCSIVCTASLVLPDIYSLEDYRRSSYFVQFDFYTQFILQFYVISSMDKIKYEHRQMKIDINSYSCCKNLNVFPQYSDNVNPKFFMINYGFHNDLTRGSQNLWDSKPISKR